MKDTFNEWQKEAIAHDKGPMMVLAGPGSGKTRVITYRLLSLLEERAVAPGNLLVVTFTKAAAEEMKKRFGQLSGQGGTGITFGTFHSVFFQIIRYAYNYDASNIIREDEKRRLMQEIVREARLNPDNESEFILELINEISIVKGNDISLDAYVPVHLKQFEFAKVYQTYETALAKEKKIDFDDMILMCRELLTQRTDICKLWQKKYQYILVDEFQDINQVQYDVLKLLALPENNLFVVGDDDQSIYGFRGANPELMFQFEKDFPGTKKALLPINYRSTEEIVKASLRLIRGNHHRFPKELKANRKGGMPVEIHSFDHVASETNFIIETIERKRQEGLLYGDMAILFRTNAGASYMVEQFTRRQIPFICKERVAGLYDHWIAKNILSYLKLANGRGEREDFVSIMNRPVRYIGRDVVGSLDTLKQDLYRAYQTKSWMFERIDRIFYDLDLLKKLTPKKAIMYIRYGVGYEEFLTNHAKERNVDVGEWRRILDELEESAASYETFADWYAFIEQYNEERKKQERNQKPDDNHVQIMTMHGAKGLEFSLVFLPGVNEGQVPHTKALSDEELEEERRMFYVAMTRAKDSLLISYVKERFDKEQTCSRYVAELLSEQEYLVEGEEWIHKRYGVGTIKRVSETQIDLYFPSLKKTLRLNKQYVIAKELLTHK